MVFLSCLGVQKCLLPFIDNMHLGGIHCFQRIPCIWLLFCVILSTEYKLITLLETRYWLQEYANCLQWIKWIAFCFCFQSHTDAASKTGSTARDRYRVWRQLTEYGHVYLLLLLRVAFTLAVASPIVQNNNTLIAMCMKRNHCSHWSKDWISCKLYGIIVS